MSKTDLATRQGQIELLPKLHTSIGRLGITGLKEFVPSNATDVHVMSRQVWSSQGLPLLELDDYQYGPVHPQQ